MATNRDVNPASERSRQEYDPSSVVRQDHAEGTVTRMLEQQAAKIPSDVFLFAAFTAMGASLTLEVLGRQKASRFVGMWPPTLLTMGVYNKLVKLLGSR